VIKCTNPQGHEFSPVEWIEEVLAPLTPGNTSEGNKVTRRVVVELMCIYCESFKRINRK